MESFGYGVRLDGYLLTGAPFVLAEICNQFGFRNPCKDGRVGLTRVKAARVAEIVKRLEPWLQQNAGPIFAWETRQQTEVMP